MIDTEALRKKVIELAIQGKLTEQLPSDGDAESLYTQILEEKVKLVKEGKIRKDKDLPPISDDEITFDKPKNWIFVRFSSIISLQSGQDLNSTDYNADGNGIPYITGASNFGDDGTLVINRWTEAPKALANKGDILLSCKGTVGKLTILDEDEVHIARQVMGIRTYFVNVSFIRYYVDWMLEVIKGAAKGLIPGIERNDILNLCCPLPPLSEQLRIVNKIEGVLSQIDIIDNLQLQYESDISVLKSKIIDAGIRGKLTEQLPEDGDAESLYTQILEEKEKLVKEGKIRKDKYLPTILDDEVPFDKPKNWIFVSFSSIISLQSGQDLNSTDYNADGNGIPYITGASNFCDDGTLIINRWTDAPKAFANRGDILLSCKGTVGKLTILDEDEVHIARQIMGIRTYSVNVSFIRYFVECRLEEIKGASKGLIPGIERNDILNLSCPLPPLAEQKRITKKIDELLDIIS